MPPCRPASVSVLVTSVVIVVGMLNVPPSPIEPSTDLVKPFQMIVPAVIWASTYPFGTREDASNVILVSQSTY